MNINLDDFLPVDGIQFLDSVPDRVKRCPKCSSVFIGENECDSCGYQLKTNLLDRPWGKYGFYTIKDKYYSNLPVFVRFFPIFENRRSKEAIKYKHRCRKRLQILCEAFSFETPFENTLCSRKVYYIELLDLLEECVSVGMKHDDLIDDLQLLETGPLYSGIIERLLKLEDQKNTCKKLDFTVAGLRGSFILSTALFFTFVVMFFVVYASIHY